MKSGDELFIVDNSDNDWKMRDYLREWTEIARAMDIATGYFEIGALLALDGQWQKLEKIRLLMGDEVTHRTRKAMLEALEKRAVDTLDASIEREKESNDFLHGVAAIVSALQKGQIEARVYAKKKFHAKAYITHARSRVVGSVALVGSSNFTGPGLSDNIELNVQLRREVPLLQEWYEAHWNEAEDVSAEILKTIERHVREYAPFFVYARALRELLQNHIPDVEEWEKTQSVIFPTLAKYQQDGYASLMQIARTYGGALLCDGVGLGKTFIGMMVIERLLRDRKKVVLFAPKAAVDPVWVRTLQSYLPGAFGEFSNLRIYAHTDLDRQGPRGVGQPTWEQTWAELGREADAIVIDEAHHFRNPGTIATDDKRESRYRRMAKLCEGKEKRVFLLTATPINNSLRDFQHMVELFTGARHDFFASRFGIHSLPTYFGELEKNLARQMYGNKGEQLPLFDVSEWEAENVLREDKLFSALVVQRSRAYARQSQLQEAEAAGKGGDFAQIFPRREPPRVADYSIKKSYGKILRMLEDAFDKDKPLFALGIYYPFFYAKDEEKQRLLALDKRVANQQEQVIGLIRTNFLKRFESSTRAFQVSCARLFLKLFDWVEEFVKEESELKRLERFRTSNAAVLAYLREALPDAPDLAIPKADRPLTDRQVRERDRQRNPDYSPETADPTREFPRDKYKIDLLLEDCFNDLGQLAAFLDELRKFKPSSDDKLRRLKDLLGKELKGKKVLVFTQFSDTARYLQRQLEEAGFAGVDEIDSDSAEERRNIIERFAPYYNGSSSPQLKRGGVAETQILISTDVLSEGLNLQDAARLINYDLHWNPVRLMQRIGRVDRRMNPQVEAQMVADNPSLFAERGDNNTVVYWNFLPPEELDELIKIYNRVAHKTLRISKTLGIETGKLLRPEDNYDELREFTHQLDGEEAPLEKLSLEWQALLAANPGLPKELDALPGRLFSGKAHPKPGARAVFFCFVLPTKNTETGEWTHEGGEVRWLLVDLETGQTLDSPTQIADYIRAAPDTPRRSSGEAATLGEARREAETSLKNGALRSLNTPAGVKAKLACWMELL